MKIDPRFYEIDRTADEKEPTDVYQDQMAVIVDNLMSGYLRNPERTEAMLRRDGMTKTADRLVELFGPNWWDRTTT
ncbi:hypothetical protein OOK13_45325 [Streptomyces sp. NBC_00378]|uniref:hypothetical protein n=1 Tax=Streptomyces sp. NBC_00378 TaxID=2975732 RepID=UPI00225A86D8|nr:hypothetical protein [Streptomyces sp. NBC_00378]MCX5115511.1 hypothetical protein [Streptomyces sp. NBC_00378]MCX5115521.1 hypothetical protein [Streptomyces sp. NBC_00378]